MTDLHEPVRWVILGAGRIVAEEILDAMAASPSSRLVGVAARRPDRAERVLAAAGVAGDAVVYATPEDAIADVRASAVYIALPNELHAEYAVRALAAGKHVLCEKPLVTDVRDAEQIAWAAERHRRVAVEGLMYRFQSRYHRLMELVDGGAVGDVELVRATYSYPFLTSPGAVAAAGGEPRLSAGVLWDVGPYCVDICNRLGGGEPVRVTASASAVDGAPVPTRVTAQLSYPSGVIAQLHCAMDAARDERVEVLGRLGRIEVPQAFRLRSTQPTYPFTAPEGTEHVPYENQYVAQLEQFARRVASGDGSPEEMARSVRNARVLEQVAAQLLPPDGTDG